MNKEKHYYTINVLGEDGYSFLVHTQEDNTDTIIMMLVEGGFDAFDSPSDAERAIVEQDDDPTTIAQFKGCTYELDD